MAESRTPAKHFSDGGKIICGVKEGEVATGDQVVTCKNCERLLNKKQEQQPPSNPNAIHFSDGEKAICGAVDVTAVLEAHKVTCPACMELLAKIAKKSGDPLVRVRVKNHDLNDGVDFGFSFEGVRYLIINNREAPYNLPVSVIKHLNAIGYPYKRYVPDSESGQAMQVAGKYRRFTVTRVDEKF